MADFEALVCAFTFVLIFGFAVLVAVLAQRQQRRERAIAAQIERIRQEEQPTALINHAISPTLVERINAPMARLVSSVITLAPGQFALYGRSETMPEYFRFTPDQLRWFGRPQKYSSGKNEIWLHVETETGWHILKIYLYRDTMRELVRALKPMVAPELVTAYRRQRPYIHLGPVRAQPANQDLHGAWTLGEPLTLYLMPRFLVLLQGTLVLRAIPLEHIQQIGALPRLDQPGAQGLLRFRAEEETLAFALSGHDRFAEKLAEAAKRTLEAPVERKRKGKEDEDFDED